MTDKPIIFSAPMVRALLDGRKTQTRRVLKPKGTAKENGYNRLRLDVLDNYLWWWNGVHSRVGASQSYPYATGDRLYVREAWRARNVWDDDSPRHIHQSEPIQYEATDPKPNGRQLSGRKRTSIHMPRWASRLTLTVTDVRVHRLQEISEADARAEGLDWVAPTYGINGLPESWNGDPRESFRTLWNSFHGPDAWDANPWICAISFTVKKGNIDGV